MAEAAPDAPELGQHNDPPPQDIVLTCSSEYKEYKFDEAFDMWSLITLKAPCQEEDENEEKRPPIDLVAVIDKSGSMEGKKLNLVKTTLEFVLTQLKQCDRLSIVTYDASVYLDFGLLSMTKENKDFALNKIKAISSGSTTNLCGGLMKGLCQMIDRQNPNEVASVLLFTDGLANNGITNSAGIVAAMGDPKRFDGPSQRERLPSQPRIMGQQQAPHRNWLRNLFPSSSSSEQKIENEPAELKTKTSVEGKPKDNVKAKSDATVYTFGFGDDHDPEMLKQISDAGNGMYYYIENEDKIAESFAHCLGGLMSTVAQGIQVQIDLKAGVSIKEVHSVKPFERISDSCIKVNIGDLQSEEKRDVVLELLLGALPSPMVQPPQHVLTARADYFNVISNTLGTAESELFVLRPETAEKHVESESNAGLKMQKARVEMTKAMKKSTAFAAEGNFAEARANIRSQQCQLMAAAEVNDDEMYSTMADDLDNVLSNMDSEESYRTKGSKLQMNMMQQYGKQRSANVDSKAFVTKGKMKKQAAAKSFVKK